MLLRSWLLRSRVGDSQERPSPTYPLAPFARQEIGARTPLQPPCALDKLPKEEVKSSGRSLAPFARQETGARTPLQPPHALNMLQRRRLKFHGGHWPPSRG